MTKMKKKKKTRVLRVYKYRYLLRDDLLWYSKEFTSRLSAEINVWIMKHIERLDIANEQFILEEVEI